MSAAGLQMEGVSVRYGRHAVVPDVSLGVAPGETLVLFGPSGAGKTVLLRAVARQSIERTSSPGTYSRSESNSVP